MPLPDSPPSISPESLRRIRLYAGLRPSSMAGIKPEPPGLSGVLKSIEATGFFWLALLGGFSLPLDIKEESWVYEPKCGHCHPHPGLALLARPSPTRRKGLPSYAES